MKKSILREALLLDPKFSKPFVFHTDASKVQLGVVISQGNKVIALCSRKQNSAQYHRQM